MLAVGDLAPDFKLPSTGGEEVQRGAAVIVTRGRGKNCVVERVLPPSGKRPPSDDARIGPSTRARVRGDDSGGQFARVGAVAQ